MESTGTYLIYALTCTIFSTNWCHHFIQFPRCLEATPYQATPSHSNEFPTTPVNLSFDICLKHFYWTSMIILECANAVPIKAMALQVLRLQFISSCRHQAGKKNWGNTPVSLHLEGENILTQIIKNHESWSVSPGCRFDTIWGKIHAFFHAIM